MKLGRVVWSKWGAPLLLGLGLAAPAAVMAEPPAQPPGDPLSPSGLLSGPSLYETGRVGLSPESAPAPTPVPPALEWAGNGEKSIKPVAADIANAPPPRPPEGVIDPARLEQETAASFETVEDCRVDVARTKRISPSKVVADRLILALDHRPVRSGPVDGGGRRDAGRPRPHGLREGGDEPVVVHPPARGLGPGRAGIQLPPDALKPVLRGPPPVASKRSFAARGRDRVINDSWS